MSDNRDVVFEIDIGRATLTFHHNGPWAEYFGYRCGVEYGYVSVVEAFCDSFVERNDRDVFVRLIDLDSIRAAFLLQTPLLSGDIRIRRPDDPAYIWYRITIVAPIDGKCSCTIQNVQSEKDAVQRLQRQAEHDSLTDLLNRAAFDKAVEERLADGETNAAFLILDIDNFKVINDTMGHQYGDAVIMRIADRLRSVMPENALIARFGGDEFVLFLTAGKRYVDTQAFVQAVRALCNSITTMEKDAGCTVSLGASFYPADGTTADELMKQADRALYHVKQTGKDDYAFYDASMPDAFSRKGAQNAAKSPLRQWKRLAPLVAILSAAAGVIILLANTYLNSLQRMIRTESLDYLREIAAQIDTSTVKTLDAYSAQMSVVGSTLTLLSPDMDMDALCAFLQEKNGSMDSEIIAAVDEEGIWHTTGWQRKLYQFNEYIVACISEQQTYMSEAVSFDGADYVLILVPMGFTTSEGIPVRAIVAFVRFDVLNNVLSMSAFDGAGHADILTTNGRIVVRSEHEDYLLGGYNLFTMLQSKHFVGEVGIDDIIPAFTAGETGSFRLIDGNEERIFHYSKLGYQDWMLLTSVPARVLESRSQGFMRVTLFACLGITLTFLLLMGAIAFLQERSKSKLERLAFVDGVTGSATREKFRIDATRLLAQKDLAYSMVYTNVDRFKAVNDRMGTDGANDLLRHIAEVLQNTMRSKETVGRIDADHFGVLLATQDPEEIKKRIYKWDRLIADYPPAIQAGLTISMSYGVYAIDERTLSIDLLLDRSNLARSAHLSDGDSASRIFFYDNRLRDKLLREQLISDSMEQALSDHRFHLYLQPQYDAQTARLIGYEALARWDSAAHGQLMPNAFIPVFERNGFIVKLDWYMFEQVCIAQRAMLDSGRAAPRISFNVSRVHLNSNDLLRPFLAIWEKYRVPPSLLVFEFTESVISDSPERLWRVVENIHRHGFLCSIDDFGSGYSSLNVLNKTNVDEIKIDKSFLGGDKEPSVRSKAIIRAIVQLAHELGMHTVAEGVETAEQTAFLREIGCDVIQGFYYAEPAPAAEALQLPRLTPGAQSPV